MKKTLFTAGALLAMTVLVQAQKTEKTPSGPPPPPVPPKVEVVKFEPPKIVKSEASDEFYKRNKDVKGLAWKNEHVVTVTRKDDTKEKYDLRKPDEKKTFTEKYGDVPPPPPPPPVEPPPPPPARKKA